MDDPTASPSSTPLQQLWRRKVVQWSLGYTAAAWGVVQAVEFAVATFHGSEAWTRVVAVVAVVGLPITATLAWYHGDRGVQRIRRTELVLLVTWLALGLVLGRSAFRDEGSPAASKDTAVSTAARDSTAAAGVRLDTHRIAILPFENLGANAANAAFVGGVHDTLITLVAKIPGLAVISRSSVLQFAGQHATVAMIAQALRAGSVLEGSVARDGSRLRIQAQLIDANTDANLWAETYDRTANDLFAVQSEIAEAVAEQLRIRLTSHDQQQIAKALTHDPAAYEHYVLGRNAASKFDMKEAVADFTRAVAIDPTFAAAQAQLGLALTWQAWFDPTRRAVALPLARAAIDKALELDPTLPEGRLARAIYYYRGAPDYDRSGAEFERALAALPSDADAHRYFGFLRRYQQRWEEAAALFGRAAELDPHGTAINDYVLSLVVLGRQEEALKALAVGARSRPDDANLAMWPGDIATNFTCDVGYQEKVLRSLEPRFADDPAYLDGVWQFALMINDIPWALRALEKIDSKPVDPDDTDPHFRDGVVYTWAGQRDRARTALLASAAVHEKSLAERTDPDSRGPEGAQAALAYALLGDTAKAQAIARRTLSALPPTGSGSNTSDALWILAAAFARSGANAEAESALHTLFARGALYKPALAWCDPMLRPLRADPKYREWMASLGVDTRIDPWRRETWPQHPATAAASPAAAR